jgi:hypothetical protein
VHLEKDMSAAELPVAILPKFQSSVPSI